jgi:nucleoside-diphosphate-sugar epimerase
MKAAILGYSGQIGEILTQLLIDSKEYDLINLIGRSIPYVKSEKILFCKTDFTEESIHQLSVKDIDALFICIGTTQKKTPNKEEYFFVDYHLPVEIAEQLKKNNCKKVFVVSSLGADSKASNFYLNTKGKMEEKLISLNFDVCGIARPSLLLGKRKEFRLGETIAKSIFTIINPFFIGSLKKYKGIEAAQVAKSLKWMNENQKDKVRIYQNDELLDI